MEHHPFYHTAIIGAGASGLFCAGSFEASKIVLEANDKPALKVSVSGGGKCNFSNRFVSAANYESQNKHFCKSALAAFTPNDFTALLDQAHIPWHARENGQLFATNAADIVRFLVQRAKSHHTVLSLGTRVLNIQLQPDGFVITTSKGLVHAGHLVLASGGISWPKLGGNTFGLKMARQLGLPVVEQRPVLCGLTFPKPLRLIYAPLAGSSTPVIIRQGKRSFEGDLLFTHEGIEVIDPYGEEGIFENANTEFNLIQKLRHDSKAIYQVLGDFLSRGEIEKANSYLRKLTDIADDRIIFINTDNDFANSIINW